MVYPRRLLLIVTAVIAGFLGCSDDTGPSEVFTVTGTIQNNTQAAVPSDARLLVVWVVSSTSPDYTYVFGEGTLDRDAGTFEVRFIAPPPSAALNGGVLGVGIIIVTTNSSISTADDISSVPVAELVGAAGQYGVIYVKGPSQAAKLPDWAADFEMGYGVGVGVQVPGLFDKFQPVDPSSVIAIIDNFDNLEFVNWT